MTEVIGIVQGVDPDKVVVLLVKNTHGAWFVSRLPLAQAVWGKIDECLGWVGKTVRCTVQVGEIEAVELAA